MSCRTCWERIVVIWTTTPWTIPGNRAISFSSKISYGLYEVTASAGRQLGEGGRQATSWLTSLAEEVMKAAKVEAFARIADADPTRPDLWPSARASGLRLRRSAARWRSCDRRYRHRLRAHRARPWRGRLQHLDAKRSETASASPFTVDADGYFTKDAPGFDGQARHHRQGREGRCQRRGHPRTDRCRARSSRAAA